VTICANWQPKDQNLVETANSLQLLPESFVFVDDNPAEREIVSGQIPGIAVPEFDSPMECIRVLDHAGYFEATTLSQADASRSEMYRANAARQQFAQTYENYTEYLLGLSMEAQIEDFTPVSLPRIVQLTNKSNQFNLTTRRYSQSEMETILQDDSYLRLSGRLADKFGDNGIVSVVLGKQEQDVLHIQLWLMSCRVLKRDMEFAMLDTLVQGCQERHIKTILGYYYKTGKNAMVKDLYKTFGFTKKQENENGDSVWELEVAGYQKKNHVITVNKVEKEKEKTI
jgi:FkbH-like protein